MGRWAALFTGMMALLMAGCLSEEPIKRSQWAERFRRFNCAETAPIVQIEVRLIERSVADPYITSEVWKYTDRWIVGTEKEANDLNRQALLERNGFRIGQVVGALPARLHLLLTSERSCVHPECLVRAIGKETPIRLGPIMPQCRFQLARENDRALASKPDSGNEKDFDFPQAQCQLLVMATPGERGRTRLKFTPRIEYGDYQNLFKPAEDLSDWVLKAQRPVKLFPELSWQVSLGENDLLLVGTTLDSPSSLGFCAFVDRTTRTPLQRLLVLRVHRSGATGIDAELPQQHGSSSQSGSSVLPLASQAAGMTVRGYRN